MLFKENIVNVFLWKDFDDEGHKVLCLFFETFDYLLGIVCEFTKGDCGILGYLRYNHFFWKKLT